MLVILNLFIYFKSYLKNGNSKYSLNSPFTGL